MPKYKNDNGETYYAYNIPEEKKKLITKQFADEFVLRLKDLYSGVDNPENQTPSDWFKDTGAYLTFTSIWNEALEKTAENFGCSALYEYFENLEWYDSDLFVCELYDIVCERSTKE